jgi:uncharacterized protein (TIGR03382 family)
MRDALCPILVLVAAAASAAPTLHGSPRYLVDAPGPALLAGGGSVGLQVRTDEQGRLRLVVLDVRVGTAAQDRIAELEAQPFKAGGEAPFFPATVTFSATGWVAEDAAGVQVQVTAVGADRFRVEVLAPAAAADDVRFVLLETPGEVDPGPGLPAVAREGLAVALGAGDAGNRFGIGAASTVAQARAQAAAAAQPGQDVTPLAFPGPRERSGAHDALHAAAVAQLMANQAPGGGFVAHRGQANLHWTWASAWQAWALAEVDAPRALAALLAHRRGQVQEPSHPDFGLRFARVDEAGHSPPLGQPGATEFFSRLAPFGLCLRALQDAAAPPDAAELSTLLSGGIEAFDWWARRRDRDGDFRYELNGALEHPQPDSPRFTAFWAPQEAALPLGEGSSRPALNAVDLNVWLAHEALELWRLGVALEHPRADEARSRALPLSARTLEANEGHWQKDAAGWFDYVRRGDERRRDFGPQVRTPALWAPLSAGLVRDGTQVRDAVRRHVLDPAFFTERGIASWPGGPVSPTDSVLTLLALSRYGWEKEAAQLRSRLLAQLAAHPNLHARYTAEGEPIGPGGDGAAAAAALLALRHADEAEVFALEEGLPARARSGYFRRVFRPSDGRVALEVRPGAGAQLPRTSLSAPAQLFSTEPLVVELDGEGDLELHFPLFAEVEVARLGSGNDPSERIRGTDAEGVVLKARGGESLEVRVVRFAGERDGCGCGSTGAPAALPMLALVLFGLRGRRRR